MEIHITPDETLSINKTVQVIVGAMGATELKSLENESTSLENQAYEKKIDFLGGILDKIATHPVVTALLAKSAGVAVTRKEMIEQASRKVVEQIGENIDKIFKELEKRIEALEKPAEEEPKETETETKTES